MQLLRIILAVFLPPVGVFLAYGFSPTLLINILLTLLGWVPGSIHAIWAIAKHEEKMALRRNEEAIRPS
ncbi:MAG: YqaE/Pmp3 family membrane protein [Leptolyngbyaceae cyanobacterium RU_5_1]|nr:YqaE/Pmp3 family membrane protein [Leptolyngbyaceae cyanobacterium RU_5_1]